MDSNLQINRKYTVLVAGNVDLKDFDINKKVEPYTVYKYSDRKEIRESIIKIYEKYIENIPKENPFLKEILSAKLQEIQEMTDEEYFEYATKDMKYDKKTGDALSTVNPKGKYNLLMEANEVNAIPLVGKSFQCKVIDLPKNVKNDDELKKLSEHWQKMMESEDMKEKYIETYSNEETYLSVMSEPLFYNAFVSEATGWLEQGDENQIEWVLNFRKRFIENLSENTILTVYNFTK